VQGFARGGARPGFSRADRLAVLHLLFGVLRAVLQFFAAAFDVLDLFSMIKLFISGNPGITKTPGLEIKSVSVLPGFPVLDLPLGFFLVDAVLFLDLAHKLIPLAFDLVQ
jgi:hypothetical protein